MLELVAGRMSAWTTTFSCMEKTMTVFGEARKVVKAIGTLAGLDAGLFWPNNCCK